MAGSDRAPTQDADQRILEIWLMTRGELIAQTGKLDHWRYYGELHELKRRPLSIKWLEAVIALGVIGRIRPAKTTGYLNRLRGKRTKMDSASEFEAFEALLKSHLGDVRMTNHAFKGGTFADLDHTPIWAQVEAHLSALNSAGYETFLNSGTLLGVVRDGKLIDHDDDIDLAVMLKADTAQEAAAQWRDLREVLKRDGLFDAVTYQGNEIFKLTPVGEIEIDLFPAWQEDGRVFVYPHTFGTLAREDVLPLQRCAITGLNQPAEPEKMLVENYGPNWRQPDPLFKFPWSDARARFNIFLKAFAQ